MTDSEKCAVPDYSGQLNKPIPQPGIILTPSTHMAVVLISLKKEHDRDLVCNALVSIENIQVKPYIDDNQQVVPQVPNPQHVPLVSVHTFASRSNNLQPGKSLQFSIGFGYDLWVRKWGMDSPKGFMRFSAMSNPYDMACKPFESMPDSCSLKKVLYDAKAFCIPEEKDAHDICIHLKSPSKPLLERVVAHIAYVLQSQSNCIDVRMGFTKQRDQLGFLDASARAEWTQNPKLESGCVTRAWNTDKQNARKNRDAYGDQYVDLGRIPTTFIGDEACDAKFKNGTFAVVAEFVHDMKKWTHLAVSGQEKVIGRKKGNSAFLSGSNTNFPRSHIVRVHISGQKVTEKEHAGDCPFTWLRPSAVQNNTDSQEASAIPMQIYRQSCSFTDEKTGMQGMHFFGYTRDCKIVDAMLQRMIGYTSTLQDLPNGGAPNDQPNPDPVLDTKDGKKYWACDKLLYYSKCVGTAYFYFPNLQQLLGLSKYPNTPFLTEPVSKSRLNDAISDTKTKLRIGLCARLESCNTINDETYGVFRFLNNEKFSGTADDIKIDDAEEASNANDVSRAVANEPQPMMQSDPLRPFLLSIVENNVQVAWETRTGVTATPMTGKVIIVGGGPSGLLSAYELKKIGVEVEILEASDNVGGRVRTFRFAQGLHAEAGAMRLPGHPDPVLRKEETHWLTDFFITEFDLEIAPFNNGDDNTWQQVFNREPVRLINWGAELITVSNELYAGWDAQVLNGIIEIEAILDDPETEDRQKYEDQKLILQEIKDISTYYSVATSVVKNDITKRMDALTAQYEIEREAAAGDEVALRLLFEAYVADAERIWNNWVEAWATYTVITFVASATKEAEIVAGHEIELIGLRKWPVVAVRGLLSLVYMPSAEEASLVDALRGSVGQWGANPMHTLRDGMDTLPRAFANPNLWGDNSITDKSRILRDNIRFGRTVYKVDYSASIENNSKVIVYAKNSMTSELMEYECDAVILAVPLPIIQNFEFVPQLPAMKSEALRATRYEPSTKVVMQFRKKFWEVNINDETLPLLPASDIIQGGISWTTAMVGQIVYPTPTNFEFPISESFDLDFDTRTHADDGEDRGILVSYTYGKEAQRLASQPVWKAVDVCVKQLAKLHAYQETGDAAARAAYEQKIVDLFENGVMQAWHNDEYAAGAFVHFSPYQYLEYWASFIKWPVGNVNLEDAQNVDDLKLCIKKLSARVPLKFKAQMNFNHFAGLDGIGKRFQHLESLGKVLKKSDENSLHEIALQLNGLQDFRLYVCGEAVSWANGWIQGAFESALRAIYQLFDNYQTINNAQVNDIAFRFQNKSKN